jgi:hypothetical protein
MERQPPQHNRGIDSAMTAVQRHPSEPPVQYRPTSYAPLRPTAERRKARLALWLHLLACLVVWPAIYGTAVIVTFVGVVIAYNTSGGPLFWPIAWFVSAIAYSAIVGIPLAICGRNRRWYIRLIPAVTAAIPVVSLSILGVLGTIPVTLNVVLWVIPSTAIVALSILLQSASWWRPGV